MTTAHRRTRSPLTDSSAGPAREVEGADPDRASLSAQAMDRQQLAAIASSRSRTQTGDFATANGCM